MRFVEQSEIWFRQVGNWVKKVETWQIVPLVFVAVMLAAAPAIRAILMLAVLALVLLLAWAWLREFSLLMQVDDDAFPGRNDKLIWAILLIVLPPVGLFLFRSYRLAHWPETKTTSPVHDLF